MFTTALNTYRQFANGTQVKNFKLAIQCTGNAKVAIPPNTLIQDKPIVGLSIPNIAEVASDSSSGLLNLSNAEYVGASLSLVRKSITFVDGFPLSEFNRAANGGLITPIDCVVVDAQQSFVLFDNNNIPDATKCIILNFYYLDTADRLWTKAIQEFRAMLGLN